MSCIKVISKRIKHHSLIGVPYSDFLFGFLFKDPYGPLEKVSVDLLIITRFLRGTYKLSEQSYLDNSKITK